MSLILLNKISDVKEQIKSWKSQGLSIGLVPTMGALHKGHESLIKKALTMCDRVIVSVFVNPIQFGPNEDFDKYPRNIEKDKIVCENAGVDVVFAPSAIEMYGKNKRLSNTDLTFVCPPYNIVDCMCAKSRPGHFDGVATVVSKLFNITQADMAFFGMKDAQQLFIIKKMVEDLNININIIPCPIVRDNDGLALSSRNQYLTDEQRKEALSINKALSQIELLYKKGVKNSEILFESAISMLSKNIELEYLEFRDYETFETVDEVKDNTLIALAVKVGTTRLIDNILIKNNGI